MGEAGTTAAATRDFRRVSRGALVAYGFSGVPLNWYGTFIGVHLIIFYTDVVGLDPRWIGLGMFLATMWDAVSDPLMGVISDRTRWRMGRRRPYILLGAVPLGVSYYFLLAPPEHLSETGLGVYFLAMMFLLYTCRTVVETPLAGLAPEIAQDYHERTRLAAYREFQGNIGDLLGLLVPLVLLLQLGADGDGDQAQHAAKTAFRITGLVGGGVAALGFLVPFWGSYEDPTFRRDVHIDFRAAVRAVLHNRAFLILLVAATLVGMGTSIVNGMFLYVLRYVVQVQDQVVEIIGFVAYIVAALGSYPFWVWYAARFGKPAAFRVGLFTSSLTFVSVFLLTPGNVTLLYGVMAFAGVANVGVWMLLMTLGADLIDIDELETGLRREGLYAGFGAFIRKAAIALGAAIVAWGLSIVRFQPNVEQTPEAIFGLRLLFALPTTLLVLAAYLLFRRFPLTREQHAALMARVARLRIDHGVAHESDLALAADADAAADGPNRGTGG